MNDPDVIFSVADDLLDFFIGEIGRQRPEPEDVVHQLA
jgi:hypothetical protein